MNDFNERIDRLWDVIDGARWTPRPQPPEPELGLLEARVLACLADPRMAEKNGDIAAYLSSHGAERDSDQVSGARSRLFQKLLKPGSKERANGRAAEIVAAATAGGHVWVPISYREVLFRNREAVLPFDRPPLLEEKELPLD